MHKMYFTKYRSKKKQKKSKQQQQKNPHLALGCSTLNTCSATGCCPCFAGESRRVKKGRGREICVSVRFSKLLSYRCLESSDVRHGALRVCRGHDRSAVVCQTTLPQGFKIRGLHWFMILQNFYGIFYLKPFPFPSCG